MSTVRPRIPDHEFGQRLAEVQRPMTGPDMERVGTSEFEPPILTSTSDYEVHEDMVVSVDVPLFFAPWGGMRHEDGYHVTATGSQLLNTTPVTPLA